MTPALPAPVRTPDVVRGDVPGLLCRGVPVVMLRQTPEDDEAEPCEGRRLRIAEHATVTDAGNEWLIATGSTVDCSGPNWSQLATADVAIDWSSPLAIYAALRWLADRGHPSLWMLPTTHGGSVAAWDGLTAWEVSAILVARSVRRVAAGRGPVRASYLPWERADTVTTDENARWWRRKVGAGDLHCVQVHPWNGWRFCYGDESECGHETGDAGKLAADMAALAHGCALQVPGGLLLPEPT